MASGHIAPTGQCGSPRRVQSPPLACHDILDVQSRQPQHAPYPIAALHKIERKGDDNAVDNIRHASGRETVLADHETDRARDRHGRRIRNNALRSDSRRRSSRRATYDQETTRVRGSSLASRTESPTSRPPSAQSPSDTGSYLENLILDAMVRSADDNESDFMPIDELHRVISLDNVRHEIGADSHGMERIASRVCEGDPPLRKIFAILCLLKRAKCIQQFIEEGVTDHDLPFMFQGKRKERVFKRAKDGPSIGSLLPVPPFEDIIWDRFWRQSFNTNQWHFLAPYIPLSLRPGQESRPLHFEPLVILPFVEDVPNTPDASISSTRFGGTSFVRRVRIHPAHHNHGENESLKGLYFAIKDIRTSQGHSHGHKEVRTLFRFHEQPHDHLIRLLATYEHKGSLNMIFHWADGNNLDNFWRETNPVSNNDVDFTRWISKQFLGLAKAVHSIHNCEMPSPSRWEEGKVHGRHGDIKPANILWFRHDPNDSCPGSRGIFKISDFGFADFHGPGSKSNVPPDKVVGYTNIYRAPEFDVAERISPRYDIWSFGCVLLEFVVWRLLDGFEVGVEKFSDERGKESTSIIKEDNFFNLRATSCGKIEAQAKRSVVKMFDQLLRHQSSTGFTRDVLSYVQSDLLQLEPGRRARCENVVERFVVFNARCLQHSDYCMRPVGRRYRTWRINTPTPVPMPLSERMVQLNLENMDEAARAAPQLMQRGPSVSVGRVLGVLIFAVLVANLVSHAWDFS